MVADSSVAGAWAKTASSHGLHFIPVPKNLTRKKKSDKKHDWN